MGCERCCNCCKETWQKWLIVWHAPAGPKTIFFWAPLIKWGMVLANVADLWRPAKNVSLWQNVALMFTGCIWARYSTVIIPINWLLFSVNLFVGITGFWQVCRSLHYTYFQSDDEDITTTVITTIIANITSTVSTLGPESSTP